MSATDGDARTPRVSGLIAAKVVMGPEVVIGPGRGKPAWNPGSEATTGAALAAQIDMEPSHEVETDHKPADGV
ncbi:hypothetical protein [Streptomyces sp. 3N207]|uniref:hypothetical protein n=1 Tax=Streptomyces sp. 3N207 TaxID=3457417 RepID=UPI003FD392C1